MTIRAAATFDAEHPDRPHRIGGTERVLDRRAAGGVSAAGGPFVPLGAAA